MRTTLTKIILTTVAALSATSAVTAGAAHAGGMQFGTSNVYAMGASIDSQLDGKVEGYAYAIAKDGKVVMSNGEGKARKAGEGDLDFTANTRVEIASATKNITAAAILQLLEKAGVSVDARVNGYFPYNWSRGAGWEDVTFRMLLAHRSGLKQQGDALNNPAWKTLWGGVQYAVSQPITADQSFDYSNMNYAALRILLARLWRIADPNNGQPSLNSTNSGQIALAYVNKYLLGPAGINGISCVSTETTALIYDGPNSANSGKDPSLKGADLEACAGHRGLNMSATDLLRWQVYLRHGNVVSESVRDLMDNTSGHKYGELGWSPGSNSTKTAVGGFWHGGDISVSGKDVHTCHAKYAGGIEASVIVNSYWDTDNLGGMCTVLLNAYNAM